MEIKDKESYEGLSVGTHVALRGRSQGGMITRRRTHLLHTWAARELSARHSKECCVLQASCQAALGPGCFALQHSGAGR